MRGRVEPVQSCNLQLTDTRRSASITNSQPLLPSHKHAATLAHLSIETGTLGAIEARLGTLPLISIPNLAKHSRATLNTRSPCAKRKSAYQRMKNLPVPSNQRTKPDDQHTKLTNQSRFGMPDQGISRTCRISFVLDTPHQCSLLISVDPSSALFLGSVFALFISVHKRCTLSSVSILGPITRCLKLNLFAFHVPLLRDQPNASRPHRPNRSEHHTSTLAYRSPSGYPWIGTGSGTTTPSVSIRESMVIPPFQYWKICAHNYP